MYRLSCGLTLKVMRTYTWFTTFTRYLSLATKYFKSVPPFNLYFFFFKLKVILFLYMMKLMSTEVSVISDINIILF